MQLYIVRHGIAIDREDTKCPPEAERYLTEEGVKKTKQVAEAVATLGIQADLMFSSPHVDGLLAAAVGASRHITSMKKAGVALVELKRLSPPNGQLVWLITPKLMRKAK